MAQAAKNLEFILNDYIALLEDKNELRVQLRRAEYFAFTVGEAVDLWRNHGPVPKGPPVGTAAPGAPTLGAPAATGTAPPAAVAAAAHPRAALPGTVTDSCQGPPRNVQQGGQPSAAPPASPMVQTQAAGNLSQPAGAAGAGAARGYTQPQAHAPQKMPGAWGQQGYALAPHSAGPGMQQAQHMQGTPGVPVTHLPNHHHQQQQQQQPQPQPQPPPPPPQQQHQGGQDQDSGVDAKRRELKELQQKIDRETQHLEQLREYSVRQDQIAKQTQLAGRAGGNVTAGEHGKLSCSPRNSFGVPAMPSVATETSLAGALAGSVFQSLDASLDICPRVVFADGLIADESRVSWFVVTGLM